MDRIIKIYERIVRLRPSGFWPGFIVGLVYFSYILWWFWSGSVYISILLGTTNHTLPLLIILPAFIITVSSTSLFWGIFNYTIYNFKKIQPAFMPLFYAGTFVIFEYARTWFVGIILHGNGGLLGAHWTFGNPAYLLSGLKLIRQSASYWGIYGVDFVMVFIGTAIFMLAQTWLKKQKSVFVIEILLAIIVVILLNLMTSTKNSENKLSISEIQTQNPIEISDSPEKFLSDFSQKNKLLQEASKKSDIVIFPESSDFSKNLSRFLDPASIPKYFANLAPKNILVIDSNRVPEQEELKSKVVLIDSKDGVVGSYDKRLLTPGGEYYPYISKLALWFFGYFFKNDLAPFSAVFNQGSNGNVLDYKDNKIKVLVCSDIVSPSISREGDFNFMVNLRNLGVFGGNDLMEKQLFSMARFRSAENGKYLVISSNFGHSYVLNQSGDIIKSTHSKGYQLLTADIVPNKKQTWYNKLGDLPILLLSLAIFGLSFKNYLYAKQD